MRKKILNFVKNHLMEVDFLILLMITLSLLMNNVQLQNQNARLQSKIATYHRQQFTEDFRQIKKSTMDLIVEHEQKRLEQKRLEESQKLEMQVALKHMARWQKKIGKLEKYQQTMDYTFEKYPIFITKKGNSNILRSEDNIELLAKIMDAEIDKLM